MDGNYGGECRQGPAPPKELSAAELNKSRQCFGPLCIEGRCRSCASDDECHFEGSPGPECLKYEQFEGFRCGSQEELRRIKGEGTIEMMRAHGPLKPPPPPPSSAPPAPPAPKP